MDDINTKTKFYECISIDMTPIKGKYIKESYYADRGVDVDAFKKILIKNDMEQYSILLLYYINEIYLSNDFDKTIEANILASQEYEREMQYEKDLTRTLQFLLSDEFGVNSSITFQKSKNSLTIPNQDIVNSFINSLIQEFKKNNYHKINLTYDEAKAMMLANEKWAKAVFKEECFFDELKNEIKVVKVEFEESIMDFAYSIVKEMEIDQEFLKNKLQDLSLNLTKKKGAKIKKNRVATLCEDLSYLKRIDSYLNRTDFEYIDDLKLTNKDYRFIHDCVVFFGVIPDKTGTLTKSLPENYIRSLITQKTCEWYEVDLKKERINRIRDLKKELKANFEI